MQNVNVYLQEPGLTYDLKQGFLNFNCSRTQSAA